MSSASQFLFGSLQGRDADIQNILVPVLSEAIIADNPIVYWKGESSGTSSTETDYSGNGYTASASFTPVSPIRTKDSTQAAQFTQSGGGNIVDTTNPTPSLSGLTEWSLELVGVVPSGGAMGSTQGLMFFESSNYSSGQFIAALYHEDTTSGSAVEMRAQTYLGGTNYIVVGSYTKDEVVHVVATRSGSTMTMYINGAETFSRSDLPASTGGATPDGFLRAHVAGFASSFGMDWTGCDFAAYDYALTAEQVADHYAGAYLDN